MSSVIITRSVILGLIVVLCPQNGNTDFNDGWFDYVKEEVELDSADEIKAYTPNYNEANRLELLPTANYPKPYAWTLENSISYEGLLFGSLIKEDSDRSACIGVLLTRNVTMTLCSCVASYLSWMLGDGSVYHPVTFATYEDLGKDIWFKRDIDELKWTPRSKRPETPYKLIDERLKGQLPNPKCMMIFKYATAKAPKYWEQRSEIALLKFQPDLFSEQYVPWPPVPILYDMTLNDKGVSTSNMWGLHPGRSPETVIIPSLVFKNFHKKPENQTFYDEFGKKIDVPNRKVVFRTTVCDQDFCKSYYPDIDRNVASEQRRRYTCLCDDNGINTVCRGLVGAAVIHNGDLHGLLMQKVQCNNAKPRGAIAIAIDGPTMDYIVSSVPGIRYRNDENVNNTQFREKAILNNYEVYIPQDDLLPHEITFVEDRLVQPRSSALPLLPSLNHCMFLLSLNFFSLFTTR